jgi:hypothetical protein
MSKERKDALWNAYYHMREGADMALQATTAVGLGSPGRIYEEQARESLAEAAEALGYTLVAQEKDDA